MMDSKAEFLYNAIQDTVSTIRAVDTKLHIVLGLYLIPLAMSDKLSNTVANWSKMQDWSNLCFIQIGTLVLAITTFTLWIVGVVTSLRGIIAISNPRDAIDGETPKGTFYHVGNLVRTSGLSFKFDLKVADYISKLPKNDDEIIAELAFEQMKLAYIRDIKILRHRRAAYCAITWGILLIMTIIFYKISACN